MRRCTTLLMLLCLVGCGRSTPTPIGNVVVGPAATQRTVTPAPPEPALPVPGRTAPAFTLAATDFHAEYLRGRSEAKAKYAGKVIELTGTVQSIGNNPNNQQVIYLQAAGDPLGVPCIFDESAGKFGERVRKGQQVRIKGAWPTHSSTAGLMDCVLLP